MADQSLRAETRLMTTTSDLATLPDSALARGAGMLIGTVAEDWLVQHSLRTYRFGSALLARVGQEPDAELLYVAAMLHDLGLGTLFDDGVTPFHLRTAAVAGAVVVGHGRSDEDATLVHDAIALHLDLASADDARSVVAGVHLGALVDVIGLRLDEIPAGVVEAVLVEHPRLDMKDNLARVMAAEIERKPYGAPARLEREFGMLDRIRTAPFDS